MRKFKYFLSGRLFPCLLLLLFISAGWIALSVWLPRTLAPVALAERLFSFSTGVFIVLSHGVSEGKTAKLLLLVLLPWTGAVLVLLWREHDCPPPLPVAAQTNSLFEKIRAITRSLGGFTAASVTEAEYFPTGREMLPRFLADLKQAKRTIYLEYYIIARGVFWNEILAVLERKVKEGVTVRVLFDDFGCCLTLPRGYAKQLKSCGIDCRVYRPLRFPSRAAQKRDHRKITVIDGEIAYTGGINLADEYIGEKIRFGHWKDTAVRIAGEAAGELSRLFLRHWDGKEISPPSETEPESEKIPCAVFADDGSAHVGATVHLSLLHGATKRLYLCTPYLAPDFTLLSALKTAAAGGTDVRILIPHVPDKKAVFLLSRSYARELLLAGVKVREYTAGFLHSKSVVADGRYCVVSSYNFDFRSMYLQAECGLFLESEELAAEMERDFLSAWAEGSEVPKATPSERVTGKIMRLFAPLV